MNAIIICWFGKFPDYYKYFEKSCEINKDYDFLIFTDQDEKSNIENIKIIHKTLAEMNELFSKKLGVKVEIIKPYKFCDFRPAYGIIFEDYLKEYKFWGHCDLDQVFGQINHFITDEILKKYEKINKNGHLTLYKNNDKINHLYVLDGAKFSYKEVFTNSENYAFDEYTGIDMIADKNNIKQIYINDFADINVRHSRYKCKNSKNFKKQIYSWENGILYKNYLVNGNIVKEEKMYLHFQKKKPQDNLQNVDDKYLIGSLGFCKFENITSDTINKFNKFESSIYEIFEKIFYIISKILAFLKCSKKQKKVWIKQKIG